ncbi:acyl-CoA dehydrogenase family protein [Myxococcota bacterium]|nr:acyl-CoA dehydrogenase family protein [Myxococcota bacterium]MCZ7617017.1 acyl-CoA dehydrogenase family protein [Myxococcota bacterium]
MDHPALTMLSEDEAIFARTVRSFADATLRPLVSQMDREGKFLPEVIASLHEMGLLAIEIPEALGGAGASFFMSILAIEELARVDPSVAVVCDVQNTLVINAIRRWGNAEQQERFFRQLAGGTIGAYALSEAGAGSDAFALACRAEERGDHFVLHGRKLWITNGDEAGLFLVFANVNPEAGYRGITCFVVERGMAGFSIPRKEDKLGIRASSTCELLFDGVEVPRAQVLGDVGKGYKVAIETLNEGRIGIGAQMVGLARGALEGALGYVREREQFGRKIAEFQAVRHRLARCATELEAARLLVYNAARLHDAGQPFLREAAMAKWFASEVAERVASECLELWGGVGFTKECPAEKLLRDAKIGKIYEGTSFIQLDTIAKSLLGEGL